MSLSLLWSLAVEVSRDVEIGPRVAIPVACPRGGEGGLNLRAWGCGCFRGPESGALAVQPRPLGRVAWTTMEGRRGALLTPALGTKRGCGAGSSGFSSVHPCEPAWLLNKLAFSIRAE